MVGLEVICSGCDRYFLICKGCWRGQKYCGFSCRDTARRRSIKTAQKKYSQSPNGRENHRKRQRLYRMRKPKNKQAEKTETDQSSEKDELILEPPLCAYCGQKVHRVIREWKWPFSFISIKRARSITC